MSDRGPDSAGVAVYRDPVPSGSSKLTLFSADPREDWDAVGAELGRAFGGSVAPRVRASHAVLVVEAEPEEAEEPAAEEHEDEDEEPAEEEQPRRKPVRRRPASAATRRRR
jgi:hypothetical protein